MRESRLDSVYLLASSNLLLEYSSILSKTESVIPDVVVLHHQLSRYLPEVLANMQSRQAVASRRSIWDIFSSQRLNPKAVEEESLEAFVAGLETVLVNLRQLNAYLEWITNQLVSPTCLHWSLLTHLHDRVNELSYQAPRWRYLPVILLVHLRLGICWIAQAEPQINRVVAAVAQTLARTRQRLRQGWNLISLAVAHCQQ